MLDNLLTRRHPQPIPYPKKSSLNDWSRGLLLQQNRLSFPTRAVLPDSGRRDDTLPPAPFPKIPQQMVVLAISSFFHFFVFLLIIFWGACPPHLPLLVHLWRYLSSSLTYVREICCTDAKWVSMSLTVKNLNFNNPRWWTVAILKRAKSSYLRNQSADFEKKLTTVTHTSPLNLTVMLKFLISRKSYRAYSRSLENRKITFKIFWYYRVK